MGIDLLCYHFLEIRGRSFGTATQLVEAITSESWCSDMDMRKTHSDLGASMN